MNKLEKILATGFLLGATIWVCEKSLEVKDKYNLASRTAEVSLLSYIFLKGYDDYKRKTIF